MKGRIMPTYDYKCKECGNVFEVFRHFPELTKEVKCHNCGTEKTERVFAIPQISGETVTGFGFKDEFRQSTPGGGMGRGMGRGLDRRPGDGRGMGRGWKRS
jgi:putative FmdB family regulatory protein